MAIIFTQPPKAQPGFPKAVALKSPRSIAGDKNQTMPQLVKKTIATQLASFRIAITKDEHQPAVAGPAGSNSDQPERKFKAGRGTFLRGDASFAVVYTSNFVRWPGNPAETVEKLEVGSGASTFERTESTSVGNLYRYTSHGWTVVHSDWNKNGVVDAGEEVRSNRKRSNAAAVASIQARLKEAGFNF